MSRMGLKAKDLVGLGDRFMHYTLNTSDATPLMNRRGEVFVRIAQWVASWKEGAYMECERLPEFILKASPVFRGGLGVMYSQLKKGWTFDIMAYKVPFFPHTASQLLWEEDEATPMLFQLEPLFNCGELPRLSAAEIKYPCLLTWVNGELGVTYLSLNGWDYTRTLFANYAVLEQAIAVGLIYRKAKNM